MDNKDIDTLEYFKSLGLEQDTCDYLISQRFTRTKFMKLEANLSALKELFTDAKAGELFDIMEGLKQRDKLMLSASSSSASTSVALPDAETSSKVHQVTKNDSEGLESDEESGPDCSSPPAKSLKKRASKKGVISSQLLSSKKSRPVLAKANIKKTSKKSDEIKEEHLGDDDENASDDDDNSKVNPEAGLRGRALTAARGTLPELTPRYYLETLRFMPLERVTTLQSRTRIDLAGFIGSPCVSIPATAFGTDVHADPVQGRYDEDEPESLKQVPTGRGHW